MARRLDQSLPKKDGRYCVTVASAQAFYRNYVNEPCGHRMKRGDSYDLAILQERATRGRFTSKNKTALTAHTIQVKHSERKGA